MDNITFWEANGVEMVTIKEADDLFRTMTKAHWDELQAKQSEGGLN